MYRFFNSSLILGLTFLWGSFLNGQATLNKAADSLSGTGSGFVYADLYRPYQLSLSLDLVGPVWLFLRPEYKHLYSLSLGLHTPRIVWDSEITFSQVELSSNTQNFQTHYDGQGIGIRIGPRLRLFTRGEAQRDMSFLGFRYGRALSQSSLIHRQDFSFLGSRELRHDITSFQASWWEVLAGMEMGLTQNLFIGYMIQFMFLHRLYLPSETAYNPYHTPGYGLHTRQGKIRLNYTLTYTIPFD
ncbi:MAG: DUF6048 family protein [Cytophagales bacterium]|nr:DUF6048 family protein [Cytophagales bacterium]